MLAICSIFSAIISANIALAIPADAATAPTLTITELLPDPASPLTDADDEYIELHNAGATDVSLKGYVVKSGDTLGTKHTLPDVTVAAGEYAALKAADTKVALANNGSSVALFDAAGNQIGAIVTYKTAPTGSAWAQKADATWAWTTTPTPGEANEFTTTTPKTSLAPATGGGTHTADSVVESSAEYGGLVVTELLPDPASPQTDAADEYIELYNSGDTAIDVAGIVVKTGASLTTKHTLKTRTIAPFTYAIFKSGETKIALSNSGSSLQLVAPDGTPIGQTITWPKATPGTAWAYDGAGWTWTTTPTPGAANVLTTIAGKATSSASAKTTASKASSSKASTASKTTKAPAATKAATSPVAAAKDAATSPGGRWLIFALLGLTIAYCLYEFRYDLQRFYHQLRGYTKRRGAARPAA